jgi:hypothetical protein
MDERLARNQANAGQQDNRADDSHPHLVSLTWQDDTPLALPDRGRFEPGHPLNRKLVNFTTR